MKKLKYVLLTFSFALLSAKSIGQTDLPKATGTASISPAYCVTLDDSKPVQNFYEIDITSLHLGSEQLAKARFGHIENNLITYHVDFDNSKVILEVHLERVEGDKDITWWNEYLTSLCSNK